MALFSFRQLPTVAAMLAERGLALDALMKEAGFRAPATTEVTAPLDKVQVLLELVAEKLANPMFGLDLAARLPEGAFGVTEFVVRTSPTIEHALRAMCELSPLINPALDMRYVADELGCEIRFSYSDERDALGDILNEYTIGYIARQFSIVLGRPLPLVRAWFAHARSNGQNHLPRPPRLDSPPSP